MWPTHRSPEGLCIAVALGLATLLSSGVARALNVFDVERSTKITAVYLDANLNEYTVTTSESDPVGRGAWSSSLSGAPYFPVTASQYSVVWLTPGAYVVGTSHAELSGTGTVSMSHTSESAQSIYHVLFTLDAATQYAFAVDNLNDGFFGGFPPDGFVHFDRVDPSDPSVVLESIQSVVLCRSFSGTGCPDASDAGLVDPGTYAFDFFLRARGSHHVDLPGTASFSLTLDEVPEPATLALIAIGLAGLAATRRRRHRGGR